MGWQNTWQRCSLEVLAPGECASWVGKAEGQARCEEKALPSPLCPSLLPFVPPSSCWFSVTKSCLTLCDPVDCSTPGFPVPPPTALESGLKTCIWLPYSFSFLFFFNWSIIALQCCVSFCHTTVWISSMRLTLVQFFQPSFSGQGREHSRSTIARVHFPFKQDKSDVHTYGANSFHPEKHLQGTELRSYLHLPKWWWAHMSPCPSSHTWWDGLAFSLALKLEDRQTRCNWDWESHKTLCWRNTEGLREEKKYQQGQHNCPQSLGGSSWGRRTKLSLWDPNG